jgi:hypothetical protein
LVTSPKKKGKFDQKSHKGDKGERHVPPEVQASVDDMEDVGEGTTLLFLGLAQTQNTWQKRMI